MTNVQSTPIADPVLDELRKRIEASGSQKAVADELGISGQHLGDILRGRRTASPSLLQKLGFARVVVHVQINALPDVVRAIDDVIEKTAGQSLAAEKKRDPRGVALVA